MLTLLLSSSQGRTVGRKEGGREGRREDRGKMEGRGEERKRRREGGITEGRKERSNSQNRRVNLTREDDRKVNKHVSVVSPFYIFTSSKMSL